MVAADTSSLIAFFEGATGEDVQLVDNALQSKQLVMPPVVLTEMLSEPKLAKEFVKSMLEIPLVGLTEGYWERAGLSRARILARGRKARVADALIAQACIDERIALISRDKDFLLFASWVPLKVLPG